MKAETVDIPVRLTLAESGAEVTRIHIEAGDSILVTVDKPLTQENIVELRNSLQAFFPDVRVIVLDGGATLSVIKASAPTASLDNGPT